MNRSHLEHTLIALGFMAAIGLLTGNWLAGVAFGVAFFLGREHAQAEARYIKSNGGNRYATPQSPVIGSLKPSSWNADSVLDFVFPIVACGLAYAATRWLGI
jgi:hypothetical protein